MTPAFQSAPVQPRRMQPKIWRACAGNSVQIPTVGSRVYYFPQGHVEQSLSPPTLSLAVFSNPVIPCAIAAVQLLADPLTDEVFAKLLLHPLHDQNSDVSAQTLEHAARDDVNDEEEDRVSSFAKILTSSDANNGGGFSVPRFCADSIFPPLNYQADPPVQTLSVTDVHGTVWNFRHIYRGTPRRHLLTTGWSKFVNNKKLVAGDSVVFIKNSKGEMFVGVRRAVRSYGGNECSSWSAQFAAERLRAEENRLADGEKVFSRSGIGKVPADGVAKSAELAAQLMPFEVVYYPRAGWSEFVVKADTVDESMSTYWAAGTRVKMAVETEDSSRMTWYQGTVSSVSVNNQGPWRCSPWRMLQITWDEAESLQNTKKVSPWEVEVATPATPVQASLHPAKKLKYFQKSGLLTGEELLSPPIMRLSNSTTEKFELNYNSFPAGMQGARQSLFCEPILSNSNKEINPTTCTDNSLRLNVVPKLQTVSTELLIRSQHSDDLSPDSQGSVLSFAREAAGVQYCNPANVGLRSFQLFGQIIHVNQPVENGLDDAVGTNHDDNNPNQSH